MYKNNIFMFFLKYKYFIKGFSNVNRYQFKYLTQRMIS